MLLAYELSNVIIYNDKKLNNSTLKGLESMNLFERYIPNIYENINRPLLIFRIRDYDMDDKIEDVLNDLFELQDDQYDTIRRTINKLYKSVNAFSTSPLTKEEKKTLSNHEYDIVLLSLDNEFAKFCEDIEKTVLMTKPIILTKEHIDTIDGTIDKMNKDKKIDYKLLDISSLNLHKDLLEFMSGLDKKLFRVSSVIMGWQDDHYNVEVILKLLNKQIDKFDLLFGKCDTTITEQYKEKLTKQKIIIEKWLSDNIAEADLRCMRRFNDIIKTYNFSDFTTKCIDLTKDIFKEICDDIQIKLKNEIQLYHKITCENFESDVLHALKSTLWKIYLEHNINIADNTKSAQNILKDVLVIEDIINYDNIDIQVKFENQKFIKDTLDKINKIKPTISDEKFFTFNLEYSYGKINMINKKYCKIDDATYNKYYVDEVNKFFNGASVLEFYDVLVRRKISEYLNDINKKIIGENEHDDEIAYENIPVIKNIIINNPKIKFISPRQLGWNKFKIMGIHNTKPTKEYTEYLTKILKYYNISHCDFDTKNIFIEEEYEKIFNDVYEIIDKRFTYSNIIKKNINTSFGYHGSKKQLNQWQRDQRKIEPLPNLYSWNITFDTPFFHDKVEEYYKKLKEQYEEEEFNKFIGLSK